MMQRAAAGKCILSGPYYVRYGTHRWKHYGTLTSQDGSSRTVPSLCLLISLLHGSGSSSSTSSGHSTPQLLQMRLTKQCSEALDHEAQRENSGTSKATLMSTLRQWSIVGDRMPSFAPDAARWQKKLRTVGQIARSKPHVFIIPFFVLCISIALGVVGVHLAAKSAREQARFRALSLARSSATGLYSSIQNALFSAYELNHWVKHNREMSVIMGKWREVIPDFVRRAPPSFARLRIGPAGMANLTWPLPTPAQASVGKTFVEHDLAGDTSPWRPELFASTQKEDVLVLGPTPGVDGGPSLIVFQIPVFISNVSESQSFGTKLGASAACQQGRQCYNATTRTRWWGNVASVLLMAELLNDSSLQPIKDSGYNMQIWTTPSPVRNSTAWSNVDLSADPLELPSEDSVYADLPVGNRVWRIYVWQDQWEPEWKGPVIAAVVVMSVVCSLLVFAVLLSWTEHHQLLVTVLPKSTIKRMREEMDWKNIDGASNLLRGIEIETPAQHMMTILRAVQDGDTPPMSLVVAVQQALQRSADVYTPASKDFKSVLGQAQGLDREVQRALANQLAGVEAADYSITTSHSMAEEGEYQLDLDIEIQSSAGSDTSTPDGPLSALNLVLSPKSVSSGLASHNSIPAPMKDHLESVLATANTWQFDAFALEEASRGHPLSSLAFWLMHTTGCMDFARMDARILARFLRKIESGYKANAYHNKRHAADVLQSLHMVIHQGHLLHGYVDQLTLLSCYIAAVVHDYEHLGRSNDYLVSTTDTLAVRYNDKSPMENHHLAAAFAILLQPEYDCLKGLSKPQWDKLRKLIIDLVLATDMRQHFALVGQFAAQYQTKGNGQPRVSTNNKPPEGTDAAVASSVSEALKTLQPTDDADRLLTLQVALKCSDLGHLAAPLPVHLKWVKGLEDELFQQGDAERERGMRISPLCDRTKEGVTKSQVGFFEFVVLPLFSNFCARYSSCQPMLDAVVSNYQYWKGQSLPNGALKQPNGERTSKQT